MRNNLIDHINAAFPSIFPPGTAITRTFDRMSIAKQEIDDAQGAYPLARERLDRAFAILCPPAILSNLASELYRDHVREILERVANKQDTRPGTRAEIIAGLSEASQIAPPASHQSALYRQIFAEIYPDRTDITDAADIGKLSGYDLAQVTELRATLTHKLRDDTRKIDYDRP